MDQAEDSLRKPQSPAPISKSFRGNAERMENMSDFPRRKPVGFALEGKHVLDIKSQLPDSEKIPRRMTTLEERSSDGLLWFTTTLKFRFQIVSPQNVDDHRLEFHFA